MQDKMIDTDNKDNGNILCCPKTTGFLTYLKNQSIYYYIGKVYLSNI